jgi:hypothetical protein
MSTHKHESFKGCIVLNPPPSHLNSNRDTNLDQQGMRAMNRIVFTKSTAYVLLVCSLAAVKLCKAFATWPGACIPVAYERIWRKINGLKTGIHVPIVEPIPAPIAERLRIGSNLWRIGPIQHVLFRPIQSVPIGPSNQSKHVLLIFRSNMATKTKAT